MTTAIEPGAAAEAPPKTNRPGARAVLTYAVLAIAALAHIGLVVESVRFRGALDHDEVISQLAATGHLDDWQRVIDGAPPTGRWTSGAEMRTFLDVDRSSTLARVRSNEAYDDFHPPLYFWSLLAVRKAGVAILWSGAVVNLIAALLAGAILFTLLADLVGDRLTAAVATAVFALSPGLLRSVAFARQYSLMMLAALALVWITARLLRRPASVRLCSGLFAVGVLGMLTDTVFVFAMVGALAVCCWHRRRARRDLVLIGAAGVSSAIATYAIFPWYYEQYSRINHVIATSPPTSFGTRIGVWTRGFFDLVTVRPAASSGFAEIFFAVAAIAVLLTGPRWSKHLRRGLGTQPVVAAAVGVCGAALVANTVAYLLGRAPSWAAGWEYVILYWPMLVVLLAAAARRVTRPAVALLAVALVLGGFALSFERNWRRDYAGQRSAVHATSNATIVIADCSMRGYLPGAAMWVRPEAHFLLAAPGNRTPPPVPAATDATHAVLLDAAGCRPTVLHVDRLLATLGFRRGTRIGPIGLVQVYRLTVDATTRTP